MMQQRQGSDGIGGSVEDQLGPLRATSILQREHIHAGTRDQTSQYFDLRHGRVRRFEGTNPGIALDVETNVASSNRMTRGERRAANDLLNVSPHHCFLA